ncbi:MULTISPECIES: helix-turn-helix transcriptional regulator [unclassified Mesorhizobium]|uniref:AraC family transcriptional regulator n=1 Tax=unclassified Mesorhizobium TaxID=325217 RepID=UPI000FCB8DDD|nr:MULTISPECIES: helix-turn-helix transcriptional regulator [unclassified Mesorhizobium]RUU59260.1 AraC family transcriptional regulator [Mesorhizobium sp. M7A.T.Ca.TU.009.01.1.1]RUU78862.1 AraC family transcriptional regulator [Mesorhizobium sp. M7A.T.Ca.TU.009.01.1.2]RUT82144.1 AraC family transcriptional regulator [Mesorhizobium sp. M7A.T.Ca.US.000.02.1.1]RUT86397.1 AraC family transcriptional regulator [Mesorhizobium sp. M7A.T.Ca.US.000.02.2.1]RUU04552.1 AraC family transcriptional regulat
MKQPLSYPWLDFDVDDLSAPAIAVRVDIPETRAEVPSHWHRKGQLVFALAGGVTCRVPSGLWMVPPHCGVWIPGCMEHSNVATANARIFFVYIEPGAADLPERCCTLSISPLLRELIIELSDRLQDDEARGELLTKILLTELPRMPVQQLHLPISSEPRLNRIAEALAQDPADRSTLADWAKRMALSESSLARLVTKETGLSFGRWRQQLHLIVAIRELASGKSVQQVSGDLGYGSVTAFITMFKKALGKPPAKYLSGIAQNGGSAFVA